MENRIDGHTGLLALFGTPVGHSGSPAMYNWCFRKHGLNLAYMAFDVNIDDMEQTMSTVRLWNLRGGNFTMPVKNIAATLCDEISPASRIIGACNVFVNRDGKIYGDVTDGVGFIKNLSVNGVEVKGKKLVVLGAGGAATAIQVQSSLQELSTQRTNSQKRRPMSRSLLHTLRRLTSSRKPSRHAISSSMLLL